MSKRRIAALIVFNAVAVLLIVGLGALALWQLHRRDWKLDLIARVEARVHTAPVTAPRRERWTEISAAADEYRRVSVTGAWGRQKPALVRAVTEAGGGFWVMTPFNRDDGTTVLINRGFVPENENDAASWTALPQGSVTLVGLLRLSEPRGAFLRSNDPQSGRWFSRDVSTIAEARELTAAAPYFIDLEWTPGQQGLPVAGLTVLSFSNNHLIYAITWSILALMTAAATIYVDRDILGSRVCCRSRKRSHEESADKH